MKFERTFLSSEKLKYVEGIVIVKIRNSAKRIIQFVKRNCSPFKKVTDRILGESSKSLKVKGKSEKWRFLVARRLCATADFAWLGCTKRDLSSKQGSTVWLMSPVRSDKAAVRDLHAKTNTCVQHELDSEWEKKVKEAEVSLLK